MGQKINPVSLRLHYTNRHFDSCWYSNYFYRKLITRDLFLQNYLNNFLKLLKLPTGRYSIQHLQKKTQIYNFLCYSKSTREWRSKLFGLTKNVSKKTRYFFKNTTGYKKRKRKVNKLHFFYRNLDQIKIHKIQKKITSFQNFRLWSTMVFSKNKNPLSTSPTFLKRNWTSSVPLEKKHNLSFLNKGSLTLFVKKDNINRLSFFTRKPLIRDLLKKVTISPLLIQKMNGKIPNQNSLPILKKLNNRSLPNSEKKNLQNFSLKNDWNQLLSTEFDNSNIFFLQNLFVYKILKFRLKNRIPLINLKSGDKNVVYVKALKKSTNFFNLMSYANQMQQDLSLGNPSFNVLNYKYKNYLESSLSSLYKLEFNLMPFKVKNDWQNASYLADEIVYFLQKRIPFRRLKSKLLRQLSKIEAIRGVRITCSGRVGGKSKKAQRAKMECIKYGQTSLQVFSSKIDFSVKTAFTSFGSVGVKVWICYN